MLQKKILLFTILIGSFNISLARNTPPIKGNDSLTLAQAYINLSLTTTYFDSISVNRISKILPFEQSELRSITDTAFLRKNASLYNFTYSLLYYNEAKLLWVKHKEIDRTFLKEWKQTFDKSLVYLSEASIGDYYTFKKKENKFYDFIGFNILKFNELQDSILTLKRQITVFFNQDIYPDFKRIFLSAKKGEKHYLDSLLKYASLYNLPLDMKIGNLAKPNTFISQHKHPGYQLSNGLDFISRYLQFYYLATAVNPIELNGWALQSLYTDFEQFKIELDVENLNSFNYDDNIIKKDDFFNKELGKPAMDELYKMLQKKFPFEMVETLDDISAGMGFELDKKLTRYYFPNPAPFPSSYKFINNYQPQRKTMKQVDVYLSSILNNAGYKNHLQYYYVQSGFAITSSLEKISRDGTPLPSNKRWEVSAKGNTSFSFYETFKSIFFETESNFRMFAFIVAPKQVGLQTSAGGFGAMQELIQYSYSSLPKDIENFSLPNKTLSILVYQFVQSDIGEVPMLEIKKPIPVDEHLKKSKLFQIVTGR